MKKIISVLLALAMLSIALFALASCGDEGSKEPKVKTVDVKLTDEEYAFFMDKDNTALRDDFNTYLASIKADGTFNTIVAKYFEGTGTKVGSDVSTGNVTNTETNFVVATNCPFEPFEYIGNDGKIYGVDIEIAQGYAAAKGLTLVVKNIDFDTILTDIDNGNSDIGMAGMTVTPDREELYCHSEPYYNASQKLVVPASCTDFDNCTTVEQVETVLKGLTGKSVGFQTGTTGNWYVAGSEDWGYEGFANITAKGYNTAQDAITDMLNGNIYAVIVDEAPANAMVNAING